MNSEERPSAWTLCIITVIVLFFTASFSAKAYPWGSVTILGISFETHQFITKQAYSLLEKDPAFDRDKFPSIKDILNYEGTPRGPDTEGLTLYSRHYFNPKLNQGKGPDSVGEEYKELSQAFMEGKRQAAAKCAAWSSHFMADMHVPYHVIGCTFEYIKQIYEEHAKDTEPIMLDASIYGSGFSDVKPTYNFRHSIKAYLKAADKPGAKIDWFDPWYWNGNIGEGYETSSHIIWEVKLLNHKKYPLMGYDPNWKNPSIGPNDSLEQIYAKLSEAAKNAALAAANDTVSNFDIYYKNAGPAVNKSIQSIYTMWRASFSALKPVINSVSKDGAYIVTGRVKNVAGETARNVQVRLTVEGGSIVAGDLIQGLGDADAASQTPRRAEWKVKSSSDKCKIKMEAFGTFTETPDLQHAFYEEKLEGATSPVIPRSKPVTSI